MRVSLELKLAITTSFAFFASSIGDLANEVRECVTKLNCNRRIALNSPDYLLQYLLLFTQSVESKESRDTAVNTSNQTFRKIPK